jgi:hypothetical protein
MIASCLLAACGFALAQMPGTFTPQMLPSSGAWHTIISINYSGGADNNGWSGYGVRQWIAASTYTGASNAAQVRVTLLSSSGQTLVIGDCFFAHAAGSTGTPTNSYDGTQTRCKFGGSNGVTIPINSQVTSDAFAYSFNATKDLLVGLNLTSGGTRENASAPVGFSAGWNSSQASCSAPNTTCSFSFGPIQAQLWISKVEVFF